VDRGAFDEILVRFAAGCGVQVSQSPFAARLTDSPRNLSPTVTIHRDGAMEGWTAAFVVDATGVAGRLLPQGENHRVRYDRLVAVRVSLSANLDPPDWMHLATSPAGWWYTLLPTEGPTQAVFMTDGDLLPRDIIARRRHLAAEFRIAFPGMRSSPVFTEHLVSRDARTTCRRRVWTGRWLPIGDARASIDPLTGAGLERAFGFAEAAAELVADFLTSGSFRELEASAIASLLDFEALLAELPRRYTIAADRTPGLTGPFWQRRRHPPGPRDSDWTGCDLSAEPGGAADSGGVAAFPGS
jgi:flavin-dependent dehydrogenase